MYLNRSNEAWKECELHPARQWARERLAAAENFERDCEQKSERKKQAAEVVLFNKALAVSFILYTMIISIND
jgi:hypothetical protein